MSSMTEKYVVLLSELGNGELSNLRAMRNRGLDDDLLCFDLFTSLWWPLRESSQRAPQRDIAWLIAKLYASYPIPQKTNMCLPRLMGELAKNNKAQSEQLDRLTDTIVNLSTSSLEPTLGMALNLIRKHYQGMDWVHLTDTLSMWRFHRVRERWGEDYLYGIKEYQEVKK
ncbi:MAG: type I-E CRISPR-associated protein Cse2/CasB [Candidatus Cloacimonadaceae bacterium]|nr:type I-E CRISPR-associated protein Cse2/CasB [Candidatus Cloacimonadaceae bacterium]